MKRSNRMEKLVTINKQQEYRAAASFATTMERHQSLHEQLKKLEEYWTHYSEQLDELKKSTTSASALYEYQQFLAKINEAIKQQKAELALSDEQVVEKETDLLASRVEVEKIRKATDRILDQEQEVERRATQKEYDELYANNR